MSRRSPASRGGGTECGATITWTIRPASATEDADGWWPTLLMQRLSEYLEQQTNEVPVTAIYRDVNGKRENLVDAVAFLVGSQHLSERKGNRGSRQIRIAKPDRAPVPDGSPSFPNYGAPPVPVVPPSLEGDGNGSLDNEVDRLDAEYADYVAAEVDEATL